MVTNTIKSISILTSHFIILSVLEKDKRYISSVSYCTVQLCTNKNINYEPQMSQCPSHCRSPFYQLSFPLQKVGCDDVLGSAREMDACGVCGSDSSCGQRRRSRRQTSNFRWTQTGYGECSSTCGVGNLLFHAILLINCYITHWFY